MLDRLAAAALSAAALCIVTPAPAQDAETAAVEAHVEESRATRFLAAAEEFLAGGEAEEAFKAARPVSRDREATPEQVASATAVMALALAAQDEPREAAEIAEQALALGPPERFLPGLHAVVGTRAAVVREWQRAAESFRRALAGGPAPARSAEQLLLAAEALARARDAAATREALEAFALRSDSTAEQRERAKLWLLDSLLLKDDPSIAMPEPASAGPLRGSIELRRGLLTERRGEREAAWALYSSISWNDSNALPAWEREMLDERLRIAARLTR